MSTESVIKAHNKQKERAIYVMGGKCQICGYNTCSQALEFHHLIPEEKEYTVAKKTYTKWEDLVLELQKCILVCANCHREIHSGLVDSIPSNILDKQKVQEVSNIIQAIKSKKLFYCKKCGKEVSYKAEYCPHCAALMRRNVERPTREILKQEIRTLSFSAIGRKYGVSDNAIRKWCLSYSLPSKKGEIKFFSDEEWKKI